MSFDIHLLAFRNGEMCAANKEATQALVRSLEYAHREGSTGCTVTLQDGTTVELYATGLFDETQPFNGAMISIRDRSECVDSFIYDFAVASSCVVFPVMESACVLVFDESLVSDLPPDIFDKFPVALIRSSAETAIAFEGGYEAWSAYRDQVVKDV